MQDDAPQKPAEEKPTEPPAPSGGTPPPPAGQFTPPVNSAGMFPHEPSNAAVGITSSHPTRDGLPFGIYVVAGLNFIGFAVGFFDTSQNNFWYMMSIFADLLLAIGLLFRLEWVRKLMVWAAGITIALSLVVIVMFATLQNHIHELKKQYDTALKNSEQQGTLTFDQKLQLDNFQATITRQEAQVGRSFMFVYIKYGVTIVGQLLIIGYLVKPKVKEVFQD